ncbi:MAG: vanadium-dependent haloperoxidase [Pseudomonadales bacterium]|nr:vanadium-dependent haloperoxidase [Pseudomonadales bacterium]
MATLSYSVTRNRLKKIVFCIIWLPCFMAMQNAQAFDFDNGNAGVDLIIPTVAPVVFTEVSPTGGDATLVLRVTTLVTNSWFDAIAPYHPTAVGVYSRLGRRPADESLTNANLNIAMLYASYRVLNSLLPNQNGLWRSMLADVGLDPDNASVDLATPAGLGNAAGTAIVHARENDGMNQLGNEGGRSHHPMPYMDYTDYQPVNTAYKLRNPSKWQPDIQIKGIGLYKIQQFVTPQFALTEPYSYPDARQFHMRPPVSSYHVFKRRYKRQADEVLEASANLNDEQKLMAELFDNKIEALGFSAVFAALSQGLSLQEFVHLDFLTNMAAFDAGIVVWQEKRRYDAVRPFSAIRYIYGDTPVTAWGGPGKGTVDLPADQWKSYLEEADHPEYPSASTCFCSAHAESARLFLGSDDLNWSVPRPAGSSRIEPGITPIADTALQFPTWSDLEADCGQSRVWAGVHFQAAVDESLRVCHRFGQLAHNYLASLLNGTAPVR